jgi:hypothetical protein
MMSKTPHYTVYTLMMTRLRWSWSKSLQDSWCMKMSWERRKMILQGMHRRRMHWQKGQSILKERIPNKK